MNHFIFERRKGERVEQFPKINSCTVKAEKQIYTKRAKETKCLEQSWKKSCTGPIRKKKTLRRCFKNAKITFNVPFWCRSLRFDRYCPFRVLYFFTRSFQTRHKLSIFSETNRYLAKLTMQWFVSHKGLPKLRI